MLSLVDSSSAEVASPPSQTTAAYTRLRRDILGGRFVPGQKLKIADLANGLEVSPGAIRVYKHRILAKLRSKLKERGYS